MPIGVWGCKDFLFVCFENKALKNMKILLQSLIIMLSAEILHERLGTNERVKNLQRERGFDSICFLKAKNICFKYLFVLMIKIGPNFSNTIDHLKQPSASCNFTESELHSRVFSWNSTKFLEYLLLIIPLNSYFWNFNPLNLNLSCIDSKYYSLYYLLLLLEERLTERGATQLTFTYSK